MHTGCLHLARTLEGVLALRVHRAHLLRWVLYSGLGTNPLPPPKLNIPQCPYPPWAYLSNFAECMPLREKKTRYGEPSKFNSPATVCHLGSADARLSRLVNLFRRSAPTHPLLLSSINSHCMKHLPIADAYTNLMGIKQQLSQHSATDTQKNSQARCINYFHVTGKLAGQPT
jgi:hypothetical protein